MTADAVTAAAISTGAVVLAWAAAFWLLRDDKAEQVPVCPDCKSPRCEFAEVGSLHPKEQADV